MKGAFGGKALGQSIHMHVAFRRPAFRSQLGDKAWATARAPKVFGEQLAAFASLLNDRASLVSFAQKAATIHNKYLGPYDKKWIPGLARRVSQEFIPYVVRTVARTTGEGSTAVESGTYYNVVSQRGVVAKNVVAQFELKLRKLHDWPTSEKYAEDADGAKATALRALLDDSIENPDPQGHQVGSWKFAKIALRHHYGDPEILGFEFRSTLDPNVLTVFEKTVAFLTTWNFAKPSTADVMLGAAASIPEYTMARVLTLDHVGEAACAKGSKPFRAFLKKLGEDLEAAGASTIPMGGLSGLRAGWCIPFVAWEAYPTLVRMRTEIEVARATFDAQVAGLAVTSATRGPKALQKLVETFVSRWAKATRLDLQL